MRWTPPTSFEEVQIAMEELYKQVTTQSSKIEEQAKKIETLENSVTVESTDTSEVEEENVTPSMAGFSPVLTPLRDGKLLVDWVSWSGYGGEDVSYYDVFLSTETAVTISDDNLVMQKATQSPVTLAGLTKGTTYGVRIRATGTYGAGDASSTTEFTMPTDLGIYDSADAPTEVGDIKLVKGTILELEDCDALTQWSVLVGPGATIASDYSIVYEGEASIRVKAAYATPTRILLTKSSGSWDLSNYSYIRIGLRRTVSVGTFKLYFGESTYDEQSITTGITPTTFGRWEWRSWDISGITAANKNAVTLFCVEATATTPYQYFWIDYVIADPGPSSIQAYDGDRTIGIYPKFLRGAYAGTGTASRVISLSRKGTPTYVWVQPAGATPYYKTSNMASTNALSVADGSTVTDVITALGDGSFTVASAGNTISVVHYYLVLWDD